VRNFWALLCGSLLVAAVLSGSAAGQVRTTFPPPPEATTVFQPGAAPAFRTPAPLGPVTPPPGFGTPPGVTAPGIGGAALQPPAFDAYSTTPGAANVAPSLNTPPSATPYGAAPFGPPASSSPFGTAPPSTFGAPPSTPPWTQPYGAAPANPYYTFPQQPPGVFPGGIGTPAWCPQPGPYMRLFSDLRMRYTWLAGETGNDLDINDVDLAATMNFPIFCGSPLRISPGFSFHFWDGPDTVAPTFADLPPQAYSAYIDARWDPRFGPIIGGELGVGVGVFSDFQSVTSDSVRVQGVGLLVLHLIPDQVALKGGIEYLDRVKVKMLPAFGVMWTPNPRVRWDIYFPRPKLSQYLTTLGNTDIWWYLGGEYGGGSWTIERLVGADQADINDIRVFAGAEWVHSFGVKGFVEVGYVFDREIIYRYNPQNNIDVPDTVMLRAGLSF
jgi:hypothetical protein